MFIAIDRAALSLVEKRYQLLQKRYGLKLSTAINVSLLIFMGGLWMIYSSLPLQSDIATEVSLLLSALTAAGVCYILFASPREQAAAEEMADAGIKNAQKSSLYFILFRSAVSVGACIHAVLILQFGMDWSIFLLTVTIASFWIATYLLSIDILPHQPVTDQAKRLVQKSDNST